VDFSHKDYSKVDLDMPKFQTPFFLVDSGASQHITFENGMLHDFKEFETPEPVGLGDGHTVSAVGVGKVKVIRQVHNGKQVIGWMTDVLHVPKLTNNSFSVHAAALKGNTISFRYEHCCI